MPREADSQRGLSVRTEPLAASDGGKQCDGDVQLLDLAERSLVAMRVTQLVKNEALGGSLRPSLLSGVGGMRAQGR